MSNNQKLFAVVLAALLLSGSALAAVTHKAGLPLAEHSSIAGQDVPPLWEVAGQQIYVPAAITLRPSADYNTMWTCSTGTARWAMVDDVVSDNDTTYIYRSDSTAIQRFSNKPTLPTYPRIFSVMIVYKAKQVTGTTPCMAHIRVNGTDYNSPPNAMPAGVYSTFSYEWTTNPKTGSAWTEADIEGTGANPLQAWGITADIGTGETIRVTQVYMVVKFF
jgi:hypothetical protein